MNQLHKPYQAGHKKVQKVFIKKMVSSDIKQAIRYCIPYFWRSYNQSFHSTIHFT